MWNGSTLRRDGPAGTPELYQPGSWLGWADGVRTMKWKVYTSGRTVSSLRELWIGVWSQRPHSSPEGATLIGTEPQASGSLGRGPLRLKDGPQIRLRIRGPRPRAVLSALAPPRGAAGGVTLSFWVSLYDELARDRGCSRPAAPWARERWGRNCWNAAACFPASWCLSTTAPAALKMCAAAWGAKLEPSETTQHQKTDSSRASVLSDASLCNRAHLSLSHYHSNRTRGQSGWPKIVSPMISTPRCGDRGKMTGCGGGVLNCRKSSSSLPLCSSTWHSAGQLMFNLATTRVTISSSSSYWGEWGRTSSINHSVTTVTSVPWRGNEHCVDWRFGESFAWYVLKHMWNQSRCNGTSERVTSRTRKL